MKVSQENKGEKTALIKIEIEENDYQANVDKQLKEQRKKVNMPGFRTGMVPMSVVKKMYETPVRAQEVEKLMQDNLFKYIDDNKIKVLGQPLANDEKTPKIDWEHDRNYTFYFDLAFQPEFTLDLKKVKTQHFEIKPTEETLNKFVDDIRYRYGKLETPDTVDEKDMVYGHLTELNEDGTPKEGGIDTNATIFIDQIALVTIKKKFIGKKLGTVVTFKPAKAFKDTMRLAQLLHVKEAQAKEFTSDASFSIDTIQRMNMAELNEEFFQRAYAGKDIKNEADFRKAAEEDLCSTYSRESDSYFLNKTSEELVKNTAIDLDEDFIKRWLLATSEKEEARKDIEDNFSKYLDGIKWQLIEAKIAEQAKIEVKQDDVVDYFATQVLPSYFPAAENETAEQKKDREDQIRGMALNMLQQKEQTQQVYNYLFDQQMTKVLKENTAMKTKEVTMDEFMKEVAPAAK